MDQGSMSLNERLGFIEEGSKVSICRLNIILQNLRGPVPTDLAEGKHMNVAGTIATIDRIAGTMHEIGAAIDELERVMGTAKGGNTGALPPNSIVNSPHSMGGGMAGAGKMPGGY